MRKLLLIGEVASLFNISTSQIRFYEKKGLIGPHLVDDNGYRLYSYEELDTLELIITYRRLNLSIDEIREVLNEKASYNFINILDRIDSQINKEIEVLKKNLRDVRNLKKNYLDFNDAKEDVLYLPKRTLYVIDDQINIDKSEKELYELLKNNNIAYYDSDYIFYTLIFDSKSIACIFREETSERLYSLPTYDLKAGKYFSYNFTIDDYDELGEIEKIAGEKCLKAGYKPNGEYIVIEDFSNFSFSRTKIHLTLQVKIEDI